MVTSRTTEVPGPQAENNDGVGKSQRPRTTKVQEVLRDNFNFVIVVSRLSIIPLQIKTPNRRVVGHQSQLLCCSCSLDRCASVTSRSARPIAGYHAYRSAEYFQLRLQAQQTKESWHERIHRRYTELEWHRRLSAKTAQSVIDMALNR